MSKSLTNQETHIIPVYDITNCGAKHRYMANGKLVHNSDKVNLQNLSKRTKEPVLRQSLGVMPNNAWVAADSSQIECRVLSYLAKQDDVVDIFKSGKDVYLDMASKIYGESYESLYEQAKGENATKEGKLKRNIGKVVVLGCISKDTEVLTKRGWVAIQDVQTDDLLWDGADWVSHDGVIAKGEKPCIDFGGVYMTPDHEVFDGEVWEEAQYATSSKAIEWAKRNLPDGGAE